MPLVWFAASSTLKGEQFVLKKSKNFCFKIRKQSSHVILYCSTVLNLWNLFLNPILTIFLKKCIVLYNNLAFAPYMLRNLPNIETFLQHVENRKSCPRVHLGSFSSSLIQLRLIWTLKATPKNFSNQFLSPCSRLTKC